MGKILIFSDRNLEICPFVEIWTMWVWMLVGKEVDLRVEFYGNFISGCFNFWSNGKTRSSEWLEKVAMLKMTKKEAINKILPRDWESKSTRESMMTINTVWHIN